MHESLWAEQNGTREGRLNRPIRRRIEGHLRPPIVFMFCLVSGLDFAAALAQTVGTYRAHR